VLIFQNEPPKGVEEFFWAPGCGETIGVGGFDEDLFVLINEANGSSLLAEDLFPSTLLDHPVFELLLKLILIKKRNYINILYYYIELFLTD
jgi:hypothetical protein